MVMPLKSETPNSIISLSILIIIIRIIKHHQTSSKSVYQLISVFEITIDTLYSSSSHLGRCNFWWLWSPLDKKTAGQWQLGRWDTILCPLTLGGSTIAGWFIVDNPIQMDGFGLPPVSGNLQLNPIDSLCWTNGHFGIRVLVNCWLICWRFFWILLNSKLLGSESGGIEVLKVAGPSFSAIDRCWFCWVEMMGSQIELCNKRCVWRTYRENIMPQRLIHETRHWPVPHRFGSDWKPASNHKIQRSWHFYDMSWSMHITVIIISVLV